MYNFFVRDKFTFFLRLNLICFVRNISPVSRRLLNLTYASRHFIRIKHRHRRLLTKNKVGYVQIQEKRYPAQRIFPVNPVFINLHRQFLGKYKILSIGNVEQKRLTLTAFRQKIRMRTILTEKTAGTSDQKNNARQSMAANRFLLRFFIILIPLIPI